MNKYHSYIFTQNKQSFFYQNNLLDNLWIGYLNHNQANISNKLIIDNICVNSLLYFSLSK